MRLEYNLTPAQQEALLWFAAKKKDRTKLGLEAPSRHTAMGLWREGVLGAYWAYTRRGYPYRKFFLPDDIRTQLNSPNLSTIPIDVDTSQYAVLETAARLWDAGKLDIFDKWHWRPTGERKWDSYAGRWHNEKADVHCEVKVVTDKAIVGETGLPLEEVRDSIKWLDRRGFLIRVLEQWDPEECYDWAMQSLRGYKNGNRKLTRRWGEPYEIRLPAEIPVALVRGINKISGAKKATWEEGKETVLTLQPYTDLRFLAEDGDPGYFEFLGDDIRTAVQPELFIRAARRVEKSAADRPYEKRDLRHYGYTDIEKCMACDFEDEFQRQTQMFEVHASIAWGADKEGSLVPDDIVEHLIKESVKESLRHGVRFSKNRLKRVKELSEKSKDHLPEMQTEGLEDVLN